MGNLLRSQEMSKIELYLQPDSLYETLNQLGEMGAIQFIDTNTTLKSFERSYINEVRRCDEIERKLRYFDLQIESASFEIRSQHLEKDDIDQISESSFENLEALIDQIFEDVQQTNESQKEIRERYFDLKEKRFVILQSQNLYGDGRGAINIEQNKQNQFKDPNDLELSLIDNDQDINLRYYSGSVEKDKIATLERILWRTTRGNMLLKFSDDEIMFNDFQKANRKVGKKAFVFFCEGEQLGERVQRIIQSFGAKLFQIPSQQNERNELFNKTDQEIAEIRSVVDKGLRQIKNTLERVKTNIEFWKKRIQREKLIYHTMNLFRYDPNKKCWIGEGWCPTSLINNIRILLKKASDTSGVQIPAILNILRIDKEMPPTYFQTNKFQRGFQNLVDSYGIANYQEVNPGPFTMITFPFLFAVMFGDLGHGFILTLTGLILVMFERKLLRLGLTDISLTLFEGRYIMLMMGIFSMYTGFLYNETFSIPIDFFGTCWEKNATGGDHYLLKYNDCVYPVGVDPQWVHKKNELLYVNSLKMKMSVIYGVSHMIMGIVLSLMNSIHFKKWINVWFEFLPQMVLMVSFFGYMVFLVFYKWTIRWNQRSNPKQHGGVMLINTLIKFVLSPGSVKTDDQIYEKQGTVQLILLFMVVISIPWMLCPKPWILRHRIKKKKKMMKGQKKLVKIHNDNFEDSRELLNTNEIEKKLIESKSDNDELEIEDLSDDNNQKKIVLQKPKVERFQEKKDSEEEDEENIPISEIFVEQIIETIEFVLGSISNTASYLRLWALSLAHSQLSKVFWDKLVMLPLTTYSFIVFFGFAIWAAITIGVLMVMESFSAFLHSLRLHWVEFQNKFYSGEGTKFTPFSFKSLGSNDN
eukprot:Anaeramoba_ignava/a90244_122.p1 GENE.a90244_122~~a90244_122.p1  ORF type:complete len:867 (+),score=272.03 a90244_122:20-2620(+)